MRILATADLHGFAEVYDWIVDLATRESVDAMVLAGDLLGIADGYDSVEEGQEADAVRWVEVLATFEGPIFYIMGNDDLVELSPRVERLQSIHGRRVEYEGFNFVGYQYSLPFMLGVYEKEESGIREDLMGLAALVDERTVLVTHSPAFGILDLAMLDRHAGSRSILRLTRERKPRAHIHGHVHRRFGREGIHFNVASGGRKRAFVIDVESLSAVVHEAE